MQPKKMGPSFESPTVSIRYIMLFLRVTALSFMQLSVTVEIVEGPSKGVYQVTVKERSPVIVVIFKVAKTSGFVLKSTSALFEVCEALKIRTFQKNNQLAPSSPNIIIIIICMFQNVHLKTMS